MSYNNAMEKQNLENYLQLERRSFAEYPLTDVDLMAFAALMYAEFERFPHFTDETARTSIGKLPTYGTPRAYMEHDCNPAGMEPLMQALVGNPRFSDIPLERFRCIVDEQRVLQFAAGCFPLHDGRVVVAYRGTDMKLVGWQEDFDFACLAEGPGEAEAVRYLQDAADAYPAASLLVCGHSKGGGYAEHAALWAPNHLLPRIERAVSFDGPAPFRLGGPACPEFGDLDDVLLARYAQLPFPLKRYIFPAMVGLMFERRDPRGFSYVEGMDPDLTHNVCSARIVDGRLALRTPDEDELHDGMMISRWIASLSLHERHFIGHFAVEACRTAGAAIDLGNPKPMLLALLRAFLVASPSRKARLVFILGLARKASRDSA